MTAPQARPIGTLEVLCVGVFIALIGGVIVYAEKPAGWFVVGLGVAIGLVGAIGVGVRLGTEETRRRIEQA